MRNELFGCSNLLYEKTDYPRMRKPTIRRFRYWLPADLPHPSGQDKRPDAVSASSPQVQFGNQSIDRSAAIVNQKNKSQSPFAL
jgi:hypothetical protein